MHLTRLVAAAALVAFVAGCAAGPQPTAMEWLKAEELKDPLRR